MFLVSEKAVNKLLIDIIFAKRGKMTYTQG